MQPGLSRSLLVGAASPRIRSVLSSYGDKTFLPILTQSQIDRSLRIAAERRRGIKKDAANPKRPREERRTAAVLVPICTVSGVPSVLFTRRSSSVNTHKSQISFPGGHRDREDESIVATALRETREELDGTYDYEDGITVLGRTGSVPSMTGTMVTPIIGALKYDLPFDEHKFKHLFPGNPDEVEMVFTTPIADLIECETSETLERIGAPGPVFPCGEDRIWGLTAIILRPILHKVLKPVFFGSEGLVTSQQYCDADEAPA